MVKFRRPIWRVQNRPIVKATQFLRPPRNSLCPKLMRCIQGSYHGGGCGRYSRLKLADEPSGKWVTKRGQYDSCIPECKAPETEQQSFSELTGFRAQSERCCGDLEAIEARFGSCPAGGFPWGGGGGGGVG